MANTLKTIIRMQRTDRSWVYVTSVKFADGPGYKVRSVQLSPDRTRAHGFSTTAAQEIAKQYAHRRVEVIREDGDMSAQGDVAKANEAMRQQWAQEQREINEVMAPVVAELRRIVERVK